MTMTAERVPSPAATVAELDEQIARVGTCEIAVAFLTYNNADTLPALLATTSRALGARFSGMPAAFVVADASSSDGTLDLFATTGVPAVVTTHDAPLAERVAVPFHG